DSARKFNAIEILREDDEFDFNDEIEIAKDCDPETLFELYHEIALDRLQDQYVWEERMPTKLRRSADEIEILDVDIDDLQFEGGAGISLSASVCLTVNSHSIDPDGREWSGRNKFTLQVTGYLGDEGVEIDSVR